MAKMNKKNLLNLFLLICVIALASIIFNTKEQSNELPRLSDTDINTIDNIIIRHHRTSTVINKNTDGKWFVTQPIEIAANNFRISSILKLLNAPVHNHFPLSQIGMEKFSGHKSGHKAGDEDNIVTSIQFDDTTIRFGITNPATKLRFVLLGDTVYTIEDFYAPLVTSHFGTLVSLNLLPEDSHIEKLTLLNQTIDKDKKGRWQSSITMDADTVSETLDSWLHAQAFGIHAYMKRSDDGLETAKKVSIQLNDKTIDFIVSDIEPWVILSRPEIGLEYHLDAEAYDKLLKPQ